ncbi:putative NADPH-quinone reductase [Aquimarina sp. EL_43]|uniref:NAD(P)H-dependent oxidoreductase n=1 Tax=unclassified Aquimarina TaxID=2627091 RepID=UPI0018CB7CA2|nr:MULTISPECIES: NAD(P)H-dependent oxidoreductase [unclassified Aquimarina]MBG6129312.1 putative NADPH-quinone reductase [Aquimarina sp. EL_35]MBG6150377.1 putative NADPH-quinone reductase [Aquimarina sp. EL_32]MBG6168315.1 putative NADPH-quinone reductase [Aquimarina sp. EL_43]
MKKILIINGHPDKESFNFGISEAYTKGVKKSNAEIKEINIRELNFNPNLQFGYRKRTELESDLLEAQDKLKWADHFVWVYPVWWGSVPAIMKGFLDRVLLPGFAFNKKENSLWWDKCFTGKTARIICTLDQPAWYYRLFYRSPSHFAMKRGTLNFIGIKKVKITTIGPIRLSTEEFRNKWLKKIEKLGQMNK